MQVQGLPLEPPPEDDPPDEPDDPEDPPLPLPEPAPTDTLPPPLPPLVESAPAGADRRPVPVPMASVASVASSDDSSAEAPTRRPNRSVAPGGRSSIGCLHVRSHRGGHVGMRPDGSWTGSTGWVSHRSTPAAKKGVHGRRTLRNMHLRPHRKLHPECNQFRSRPLHGKTSGTGLGRVVRGGSTWSHRGPATLPSALPHTLPDHAAVPQRACDRHSAPRKPVASVQEIEGAGSPLRATRPDRPGR